MEIVPLMELDECFFVHHASFQIQLCVLKTNAVSLTIICYHLNGKQVFKGGQALSMISKENVVENSNCYGEPKCPQ